METTKTLTTSGKFRKTARLRERINGKDHIIVTQEVGYKYLCYFENEDGTADTSEELKLYEFEFIITQAY